MITSLGIMIGVALVLSMPYLLLFPLEYLRVATAGLGSYWFYDVPPAPTHPVPVSALAVFWPEPFKFIVIAAVFNGIPWAVSLGLLWLLTYLIPEQSEHRYREQVVFLTVLLSLALHIFWARGIYKYYLIATLPFLVLFGAVIRGPLIPSQSLSCPFSSRLQQHFQSLQALFTKVRVQFRNLGVAIVNGVDTWWFVLVGLASIGIFVVHRYHTHFILLMLFLPLVVYGFYNYYWRKRQRKKNVIEKSQSQPVLNTNNNRHSN